VEVGAPVRSRIVAGLMKLSGTSTNVIDGSRDAAEKNVKRNFPSHKCTIAGWVTARILKYYNGEVPLLNQRNTRIHEY